MRNDIIYILNKYQSILNTLKQYHIQDGLCKVSQSKIANELKVHQTNISHAFKTINYEQKNIIKIKPGLYKVSTFDINELATFKKIKEIISDYVNSNCDITKLEKMLAKEYNCDIKTIKFAKAIITGSMRRE